MVTANGKPSGTATTNTVIPVIRNLINGLKIAGVNGFLSWPYSLMQNRTIRTITVQMAMVIPP